MVMGIMNFKSTLFVVSLVTFSCGGTKEKAPPKAGTEVACDHRKNMNFKDTCLQYNADTKADDDRVTRMCTSPSIITKECPTELLLGTCLTKNGDVRYFFSGGPESRNPAFPDAAKAESACERYSGGTWVKS